MAGPVDPVSTFLHHALAWSPGTYVNIEAYTWMPKPGGALGEGDLSPRKGSRACRDLAEAANYVRWQNSQHREVYLRMATHRQPGVGRADKRGRVYYSALGGKANAVALKSWFIDVDVKPGAHGTAQEARDAVAAMCAATGLPPPSMPVHSGGGGFHAHWVTTRPVPVADWLVTAKALAAACRTHGVHADHNLTVNPVCLLRVPGTTNNKYGDARPVILGTLSAPVDPDKFAQLLEPFVDAQAPPENLGGDHTGLGNTFPIDPLVFPSQKPVDLDPSWTAGISSEPYTLEEVGAGCPLVRETLATGGAGQKEPLWFALGRVALFTAGGVKDYHRLSAGHHGYLPAATDEKFARVQQAKIDEDFGWPRCQGMVEAGATQCAACPHKALGKSPLNFAVRRDVTPLGNDNNNPDDVSRETPPPPPPLKREVLDVEGYISNLITGKDHGKYSYEVTDRKGNIREVRLWDCPMWNLDYKKDPTGRFSIHFDTSTGTDEPVHVSMPTSALIDTTTLRRCLWEGYGLGTKTDEPKEILNFMAAFTAQMREKLARVTRQELMGWSNNDAGDPVAFIYGPTKFNCVGNTPFYQPSKQVKGLYFPVGSLEPWTAAMNMLHAEKRPEMELLVATAFAAPLMRFTSEKGVVISAYSSGTAVHKSTALKIGQAVWGGPLGIHQLRDTENSVMSAVGLARILPVYYDEMKSSLDIKKFLGMVYVVTSGRGKGRLNRNAEARDIDSWDTLLVGVSNDSLFDYIAQADKTTDAGVARIFEFEVTPPTPGVGQISMGTAGDILNKLETNYGHAGLKYAEHLGKSVETLPKLVSDTVNALQKQLGADGPERFWISAAAVLLVGAQMANDIGLTRFDLPRMGAFITTTFTKMRAQKLSNDLDFGKKDSIRAVLASYLNTHRNSILATDTVGQAGRAGQLNRVAVLNLGDIHYAKEFVARYVQLPTPHLRLSKPALVTWLNERRMSPGVLIKNLDTHYGMREATGRLTSGTSYAGAKERLIDLDLTHPDLIDLYEVT